MIVFLEDKSGFLNLILSEKNNFCDVISYEIKIKCVRLMDDFS